MIDDFDLHDFDEAVLCEDLDDDRIASFGEDDFDLFGGYRVRCSLCGLFYAYEVMVLNVNEDQGYVEFRCPQCNEFRSSHLIVVD